MTGWPSRRAATALLLVCVGAAALLACGGSQQAQEAQEAQDGGSASPATPVVVVGIDGAEWSVIRRQWEEGRLPALRALAEAGVRTLDVTSHLYWRYWEPERFPPLPPQELRAYAGEVPRAYDAVDRALARIVGAAGGRFNVVVLSDHGFRAAREVETRVFLDLDAVLERLGYLERGPDGEVDLAASSLYTFATAEGTPRKKVRFGARVRGMDENGSGPEVPSSSGRRATPTELRSRLANDLDRVTYRSGAAVLALRELSPIERREGAELMLDVLSDGASEEVLVDGEPVPGAVSQISRISGTHTKTTHGIFLAAGPDIDPRADLTGIRIQDIASTLLYGLGLPVAEDSVGDARLDLYRPELRRRRSLRTVASWGRRDAEPTGPEAGDEEHLRQLRALGYLD